MGLSLILKCIVRRIRSVDYFARNLYLHTAHTHAYASAGARNDRTRARTLRGLHDFDIIFRILFYYLTFCFIKYHKISYAD